MAFLYRGNSSTITVILKDASHPCSRSLDDAFQCISACTWWNIPINVVLPKQDDETRPAQRDSRPAPCMIALRLRLSRMITSRRATATRIPLVILHPIDMRHQCATQSVSSAAKLSNRSSLVRPLRVECIIICSAVECHQIATVSRSTRKLSCTQTLAYAASIA